MKALTIFNRCRGAEAEKRIVRAQIERRRDAITCITPRMDAGGGHGSAEKDKIGAFAADVIDLEARLMQRERAHSVEIAAACSLLDLLPERESAVLHQYYIKGTKTPVIAKRMGYTESYIRKIKAEGERKLSALDEKTVENALPAWYKEREVYAKERKG